MNRALPAFSLTIVPVLAYWFLGRTGPGAADPGQADRARAAVQAGEVLPWPTVFDRLQRTHPGQVLDLELEREDGRWIYEVRLLQADGRLLKLEVDARSGEVLRSRPRQR